MKIEIEVHPISEPIPEGYRSSQLMLWAVKYDGWIQFDDATIPMEAVKQGVVSPNYTHWAILPKLECV